MSNKQSSIEWLIRNVNENIPPKYIPKEVIDKAKAMHKEEVMDAYQADLYPCSNEDAEQYYKETFEGGNK